MLHLAGCAVCCRLIQMQYSEKKILEKVVALFDLVGGFAAKEVVVSTLGTAYSLGKVDSEETGSLAVRLKTADGWGPVTAFSLILFTIFYAPCFVTIVCISRETESWKWSAFSMIFNTTFAFGMSVIFYQIASRMVV